MSERIDRLRTFVEYWRGRSGDEKGEAQVFCDRLFRAFGHEGYQGSGGGARTPGEVRTAYGFVAKEDLLAALAAPACGARLRRARRS